MRVFTFILYSMICLSNGQLTNWNDNYNNTFYIANNITGTGNYIDDVTYRKLCINNYRSCICCIGEIEKIRCGLPIICQTLIKANNQSFNYSVIYVTSIVVFLGIISLTIGLVFKSTEHPIIIFCLNLGIICLFPISLIIILIIYGGCSLKKEKPVSKRPNNIVIEKSQDRVVAIEIKKENDNNVAIADDIKCIVGVGEENVQNNNAIVFINN